MPRGWWLMDAIDKPHRLEFANGLSDEDGEPMPGVAPMPTYVTFELLGAGTRMIAVTHFLSVDQMKQMLDMGMQEGFALAMSQIDGLLSSALA